MTVRTETHTSGRAKGNAVIALMAVGSGTLWIGSPPVWLWLAAKMPSGGPPTVGPPGLLLLGIILSWVAIAKGLAALNRLYGRVTGTTPKIQIILPWRRSLRGGRSQRRETDGRLPV